MNTIEKQVSDLLKSNNINFQSVCLGKGTKGEWECYKFTCILGGETFEFSKGLWHGATREELIVLGAKTGCFDTRGKWLLDKGISKRSKEEYQYLQDGGVVLLPNAAELLYSLIIDSDSASDTFSEFCFDYGYTEDSRKALELYLECQKIGDRLRKAVPYKVLDEVRELLVDY